MDFDPPLHLKLVMTIVGSCIVGFGSGWCVAHLFFWGLSWVL